MAACQKDLDNNRKDGVDPKSTVFTPTMDI